jgi:hypothetical protein
VVPRLGQIERREAIDDRHDIAYLHAAIVPQPIHFAS